MAATHRLISVITGLVILAGVVNPAAAEFSLREKQFIKQQEGYLADSVKKTNEKCGITLQASIDWASFQEEMNKQLDNKLGKSFYGYCAMVPDNMWSMCSDADAKAAIQKKIKTYVCKFGGKGKRSIALQGSRVTFWVDWEAPNNDAYIKAYLGKKL